MLLIKNTKAEAHGLTREDKKSQAPAFPHSNQFPTNTDILGEAQTLPPMWEDRERGGKKDHLERYIPSTRLCPTGTPRGCLVPVLNYKIPRAQETGKARVSSCTYLTFPLLQRDQRNFSFFCATTGGKVPAPKPQSVTKIAETTNKPRDKYLFVSTQKCVWFMQPMREWRIICWLV